MDKLIAIIKNTLQYDESKPAYSVAGCEKLRNDETWKEYKRTYYQRHKEEMIKKNLDKYYQKKTRLLQSTLPILG